MASTERLNSSTTNNQGSAGMLADVLRDNKVYLRGSAMGKGFRRAARYYLQEVLPQKLIEFDEKENVTASSANDDEEDNLEIPAEESFYVVDLGVVVSQFFQWRKHFPRVSVYYAVKCCPDPVIVQTLATLGANFDCASRQEIKLVQDMTQDMPNKPDIIYANPCKARAHIVEAVRRGVYRMTFDNTAEVAKCASVSKKIELIVRMITDDSGSQCRLSSKFGAPRAKWRSLLAAAKEHGLKVVGCSFHVGSGCHDASRYDLALRDAKELIEMGKNEFGFNMHIVDIGGGFPGETHSLWNPADRDVENGVEEEEEDDEEEPETEETGKEDRPYMFFNEIAEHVAPVIDSYFPEDSGIQVIAEPGRYLVAACATLMVNVSAVRCNVVDESKPTPVDDKEASEAVHTISRKEENMMVQDLGETNLSSPLLKDFVEELADYSSMYARQNLAQQEVDLYTDRMDFSKPSLAGSMNLLSIPEADKPSVDHHTVEGMPAAVVNDVIDRVDAEEEEEKNDNVTPQGEDINPAILSLAAAGEAAVAGVVIQSVADNAPVQDDFSYYVNDGVYGGFNNIMFDHAVVRPRVLRNAAGYSQKQARGRKRSVSVTDAGDGFMALEYDNDSNTDSDNEKGSSSTAGNQLYTSTIFGPTCDSIDVICRSVLLPKLDIGSWLYFNNMGAYTMAAASSFNGFEPTERFYVCSVQPEHFKALVAGPAFES